MMAHIGGAEILMVAQSLRLVPQQQKPYSGCLSLKLPGYQQFLEDSRRTPVLQSTVEAQRRQC